MWTSETKAETVQGGAGLSFWFWRYPGGWGGGWTGELDNADVPAAVAVVAKRE